MGLAAAMMGVGTVMQMGAARQQAKTQAAIAKYNAQVNRQKAKQARKAGAEEARRMRMGLRRDLRKNRASNAAAGMQMTGSPLDTQLALIDERSSDIAQAEYNTRVGARQYDNAAILNDALAKSAKRAGKFGIGSALVGGISDLAKIQLYKKLNS